MAQLFGALGELVATRPTTRDALRAVVDVAAVVVPGTRWASVTRGRGERWTTEAASHSTARELDTLQYTLGTGPCLDAITDHTVFSSNDLTSDTRWAGFGARATTTAGARSVLSIRLAIDGDDDDLNAGLNMYSDVRDAFDDDSMMVGTLLATHAGIALAVVARRQQNIDLTVALESARVIGMAMGIIMSTTKVTREQAFDLLRVASQNTNMRVRDLAEIVAHTGVLEIAPRRL